MEYILMESEKGGAMKNSKAVSLPKWMEKIDQYSDSTAIKLLGEGLIIAVEALEHQNKLALFALNHQYRARVKKIAQEALRRIAELGGESETYPSKELGK